MARSVSTRRKLVTTCLAWAVGIAIFFPILWTILTSFKTGAQAIADPPVWFNFHWTFENYVTVQERSNYFRHFWNSVVISGGSTLLGLIIAVAHRKGGRGMATEYELHLDPSTNEKAVKLSGFTPLKADIHDISATLKADICDQKPDIHDISETLKADICDTKADICDQKADICDQKADTGVLPIVKKRNRTVIEPLVAEVATSTSRDPPDWFNVLSSLERFDQSFEICQDWVGKHGVPEVLAQRLAYSLKDWLSRQQAGSKALRGDPWTRFTAWVVRDLTEAPSDAGGTDKYLVAQDEAKRRGK